MEILMVSFCHHAITRMSEALLLGEGVKHVYRIWASILCFIAANSYSRHRCNGCHWNMHEARGNEPFFRNLWPVYSYNSRINYDINCVIFFTLILQWYIVWISNLAGQKHIEKGKFTLEWNISRGISYFIEVNFYNCGLENIMLQAEMAHWSENLSLILIAYHR